MTDAEKKERGIEAIPGTLIEAIYELEKDEFVQDVLGKHVSSKYIEAKKAEWAIGNLILLLRHRSKKLPI